ncbi:MAG: hypothetical protein ACXQT5_07025 [Candidatus Syntropharchaeia archaeon]
MTMIFVIDASSLEEVLVRINEEFLRVNKVAMGKPRLIRQYNRMLNDIKEDPERYGRIVRVLRHFIRGSIWVRDDIEHSFDCIGEIPRKDPHLFVTAKEAALMEGAKEGVVVSSDEGAVEVKECENGRARVLVLPVEEFQEFLNDSIAGNEAHFAH